MRNKLFYVLAIVALFATGCTKDTDKIEPSIIGSWRWLSTDGGLGNHLHQTPASTGENRELKLTQNRRYQYYTNGALTAEGTFSLEERKCIHDHKLKTFIHFTGTNGAMLEEANYNKMILADEAYDGIQIMYERKK